MRLETPVLGTAMSKSSRIRRSRILGLYAGSRDCTPVLAFETGIFFRGFGLGRLVSNGFLCAKAGHSDQRFCRLCNQALLMKLRFSLQRHKSSRILQSRILGWFAGFRFCVWKLLFYQQPCAKAPEFGASRILGQYAG